MTWLATTQTILCFIPLAYFAILDYRTMSIPAAPLEIWCTIICLYGAIRDWHLLAVAIAVMVVTGAFAWCTRGMGSADVLVIGALAATLGLLPTLWGLLLACMIGCCHCLCSRTRSIPFVPALFVGNAVIAGLPLLHLTLPVIGAYTLVLLG